MRPILAQQAAAEDCAEPEPVPAPEAPVVAPDNCEDDLEVDRDWCPASMGAGNTSLSHGEVIR